MAQEVSGLVQGKAMSPRGEEWHDPEGAGEDQPDAAQMSAQERRGAPPGMQPEEIEERSRLGRYINRSALPADRDGLLASARDNEAPDDVLDELSRLPAGDRYETINQVWAALGHHNEARRT